MRIKKLIFVFALAVIASSCTEDRTKLPPNIILIMVDDLGKEWISCYGAEDIQTPNIDRLAEEGILFHNAYSMPQCTPTRITLLTGQYPFRHGWVNHWDVPRWGGGAHFDPTMNPSLGLLMKEAGYKTAIAGKWQVSDFRVQADIMEEHGFDEYCMWTGFEGDNPKSAERYWNPYIISSEKSARTYRGGFGPDIFKDFIIDFIYDNRDTSMFIYYPMVLTHGPLVDTPDEEIPKEDFMGRHKAMVRYTDKLTGSILDALEKTDIREHSYVIWTTDNGTGGGITGTLKGRKINGGKSKTTEPGICAPFLVSCPEGFPKTFETNALIDFSDILPTCLDIAGARLPDDWIFDGTTFLSVLKEKTQTSQREWIMSMGGKNNARLTEKGVENEYVFRDRVVRNATYKLYINISAEPEKLINLIEDPDELNNLLNDSLNKEDQAAFNELKKVISLFPERDNDPVYKPTPPQNWDVPIRAESQVWKKQSGAPKSERK